MRQPTDSTGKPVRVGDSVRWGGDEYTIVRVSLGTECVDWYDVLLLDGGGNTWRADEMSIDLIASPPPAPPAPWAPPTRRYRCRKGHTIVGQVPNCFYASHSVLYCPRCYLDLIDRECGGLEELPPDFPPSTSPAV